MAHLTDRRMFGAASTLKQGAETVIKTVEGNPIKLVIGLAAIAVGSWLFYEAFTEKTSRIIIAIGASIVTVGLVVYFGVNGSLGPGIQNMFVPGSASGGGNVPRAPIPAPRGPRP
jgi:hypothetical protein